MAKEIVLRQQYLSENIGTIYFGGGTPSLLSDAELEQLIHAVTENFTIEKNAEVTLEINPDDISSEKLAFWKSLGVNRFSIGIQTFNDRMLKYLNRIHSAKEALESIDKVRAYGFDNFSIDLIYALPSEDHTEWKTDVKTALNLEPKHLSAYSLTIESGTVFGKWLTKGKIQEMDENFSSEQYLYLSEKLTQAGYEHYEVSNFALPGYYSRHNTSYWKGVPYIGIGPGAHSYNGFSRQANISNNPGYIKVIKEHKLPSEAEILNKEDKVNEYLLTRLRTCWGIDLKELNEKYSYTLSPSGQELIDRLIVQGLGDFDGDVFKLTEKGFLLADQVALELSI